MSGIVFVLLGCGSASVDLEEEPFGNVKSAVWLDLQQDVESGDDPHFHQLMMSTTNNVCKSMQDLMQPLADSYSQHFSVIPYDTEEACELSRSYFEEAAVLVDDLYEKDGANQFLLEPYDPDADLGDPPDGEAPDGTQYIHARSDTSHYFFGTVNLITRNPWTAIAEEIRCGEDSDALNDDIEEALAETVQALYLSSGTLTLETARDGEALRLYDFAGGVVDDDQVSRGTIEAKGTFEHCTVAWRGEGEAPLLPSLLR